MESNMSVREFWLSVLLLSFKGSLGVVRAIMFIATIALAIISSQHLDWGKRMNMLAWALPLGIFLVLFVPSIMLQAHRLYKQKADKVQEYETEAIELEENVIWESRRGLWVARIGVRALGQKTVHGIFVYLRYIDGNENGLFDAPLHPTGRLRNVTGAITVNPGDTQKFVEVLHWNSSVPEMGIPYNLNYQLREMGVNIQQSPDSLPDRIDVGTHTLTLYATGGDIKPIERIFKVDIVNGRLDMHRINNEQQQEG